MSNFTFYRDQNLKITSLKVGPIEIVALPFVETWLKNLILSAISNYTVFPSKKTFYLKKIFEPPQDASTVYQLKSQALAQRYTNNSLSTEAITELLFTQLHAEHQKLKQARSSS